MAYASTPGTTNLARTARLLLGPCTGILRKILKNKIHPNTLTQAVKNVITNHRTNPFTKQQMDIICPSKPQNSQYRGDFSDLDLTLLYTILRNCCNITPHNKGWGNDPDIKDRGESASIERIRLLRNRYYGHQSSITISDAEFNALWQDILQIIKEIEATFGTSTDFQDDVIMIKKCSMDPQLEDTYIQELLVIEKLQDQVTSLSGK